MSLAHASDPGASARPASRVCARKDCSSRPSSSVLAKLGGAVPVRVDVCDADRQLLADKGLIVSDRPLCRIVTHGDPMPASCLISGHTSPVTGRGLCGRCYGIARRKGWLSMGGSGPADEDLLVKLRAHYAEGAPSPPRVASADDDNGPSVAVATMEGQTSDALAEELYYAHARHIEHAPAPWSSLQEVTRADWREVAATARQAFGYSGPATTLLSRTLHERDELKTQRDAALVDLAETQARATAREQELLGELAMATAAEARLSVALDKASDEASDAIERDPSTIELWQLLGEPDGLWPLQALITRACAWLRQQRDMIERAEPGPDEARRIAAEGYRSAVEDFAHLLTGDIGLRLAVCRRLIPTDALAGLLCAETGSPARALLLSHALLPTPTR